MYDVILEIAHAIVKNGLTLSTAGTVVFLILKQRRMKARLKRFIPWMFQDDSEVKPFVHNQEIIMKNQEIIMKGLGLEPCVIILNEKQPESANLSSKYYLSSWAITTYARLVNKYTLRRYLKMEEKEVVINAGHGETDPGAVGPTGKKEKDFNLTLALKIENLLKDKLKVTLTRRTDIYHELKEIVNIANKTSADLFISIHANANNSPAANGVETYYNRTTSKPLAGVIHKHMAPATGLKDRGVKYGPFYVIKNTKMDAILLEVGFISNPDDEKKLFDSAFQDRVALAIAQGICEYLGVPFDGGTEPVKLIPRQEMKITVHTDAGSKYTGFKIKDVTWVPSRPIGELLGGRIGYRNSKVTINGSPVETKNIDGVGYVTARDLTELLGARIFWDKAEPSKVEIYPK